MILVVIGMVLAIMVRSVLADLILANYIGVPALKYEILDILLGLVFIICANTIDRWLALIIYTLLFILRIVIMRKHINLQGKHITIIV